MSINIPATLVSLLFGTAIPTLIFIFVTVSFYDILKSISHAIALRIGRELLVPYPQS